jgi:hypothetical protein
MTVSTRLRAPADMNHHNCYSKRQNREDANKNVDTSAVSGKLGTLVAPHWPHPNIPLLFQTTTVLHTAQVSSTKKTAHHQDQTEQLSTPAVLS